MNCTAQNTCPEGWHSDCQDKACRLIPDPLPARPAAVKDSLLSFLRQVLCRLGFHLRYRTLGFSGSPAVMIERRCLDCGTDFIVPSSHVEPSSPWPRGRHKSAEEPT